MFPLFHSANWQQRWQTSCRLVIQFAADGRHVMTSQMRQMCFQRDQKYGRTLPFGIGFVG